MDIHTLLERLFSSDHEVKFDGCYFSGTGHTPKGDVAIIGTTDAAPIGVELAYRMAGEVLAIVRKHPRRPILLLVDTQGQRLSHRDELLGINGYMAHLAKCVELARKRGHRLRFCHVEGDRQQDEECYSFHLPVVRIGSR